MVENVEDKRQLTRLDVPQLLEGVTLSHFSFVASASLGITLYGRRQRVKV